MQGQPIKKSFFSASKTSTLHHTQTNVQLQISSTKTLLWACSTTTLFRNFAILRQHKGYPFAPIQILTGDIREGCHARHSRLHDVGRSLPPKSRIERRFESRVAGLAPRAFWLLFARRKKNKTVPFAGRFEVLQTSNQLTKATTSHKQN